VLTATDIEMLTLRSGYVSLTDCYPYQTVNTCFYYGVNSTYSPEYVGEFYYNGGHMQMHATLMDLGPLDRQDLAAEIKSELGSRLNIRYSLPLLAGGAYSSPAAYAVVLRKMMTGKLLMGSMLGSYAVCTNPETCSPDEAVSTPTPPEISWHYSIGHWVEDDPASGDGSFSSPGTLGFYPWISASKLSYGIVARWVDAGNWWGSVQCGQLIRNAWQTGSTP
jgi:hypothetical protein